MQSELMERKCDFCGEKQTFEKGVPLTKTQAEDFKSWVTLVWEIPVGTGQGLKPFVKHGCRQTCAVNIVNTFDPTAEIRAEQEAAMRKDDRPILVGQA